MATSIQSCRNGKDRPIRIAIIGAGIAGSSLANGLLKHSQGRVDVHCYERDSIAFDLERGGYQLRITSSGLNALKHIADDDLWAALGKAWAGDEARAPTIVDPDKFRVYLNLWKLKLYPQSRPVARIALRRALLQPLIDQDRVHLSHTFSHFDLLPEKDGGVQIHFKEQPSQHADIVIAADGSNSRINVQVGLATKKKLDSCIMFQARSDISATTRDTLPQVLIENGSTLLLGGSDLSGFASLYSLKASASRAAASTYTLFWSILVPRDQGERMLKKADNDVNNVIPFVLSYLRNDLGYGESLPRVIQAATSHMRTGLLTSSTKPKVDWRKGTSANARVILLGDAVHPMAPGRGMGANMALADASNLVKLLSETRFAETVPSDDELSAVVRAFDKEMFDRAFEMVKKSEDVGDLHLGTVKGKVLIGIAGVVLTSFGWVVSILEFLGLKKPQKLDFDNHYA